MKTKPCLTQEDVNKILDAAERLFSGQGYAATSLRHITGEAGVNLESGEVDLGEWRDGQEIVGDRSGKPKGHGEQ